MNNKHKGQSQRHCSYSIKAIEKEDRKDEKLSAEHVAHTKFRTKHSPQERDKHPKITSHGTTAQKEGMSSVVFKMRKGQM